jgi:hypothetical protein
MSSSINNTPSKEDSELCWESEVEVQNIE